MKNYLLLSSLALLLLLSACSKDDDHMSSVTNEITTIDSLDHSFATELLRLNILAEYGGVFRQMQMYHAEVFDLGVPCDSTFVRELVEDGLPKYSLTIPIEVNTDCKEALMTYNNRWYTGYQQNGTQTSESDLARVEVKLNDKQVIAGNADDDVYTYGQNGLRSLFITKGIAAELDPTAELHLFFPNCNYDRQAVGMTDIVKATFNLVVSTNEFPTVDPRKQFEGTIQLIDGRWTIEYEDGVIHHL